MKKLGYTIINIETQGIKIKSTEVAVLEMTKGEIRRIMPQCLVESDERVNPEDKFRKMPVGDFYFDMYKNLDYKHQELGWWLIKKLVSIGWKPFLSESLTTLGQNLPPSTVETHLRFEYE